MHFLSIWLSERKAAFFIPVCVADSLQHRLKGDGEAAGSQQFVSSSNVRQIPAFQNVQCTETCDNMSE